MRFGGAASPADERTGPLHTQIMGMSTFRYFEAGDSSAFYWRRRLLVLAAGLTVLAVIAWTFASVLSSGATTPSAGAGHGPAPGAARSGGRGGPAGRPAAGPAASPSPTPAQTASPAAAGATASPPAAAGTAASSPAAAPHPAGRPAAPAPARPAAAGRRPPVCRRRYVVLTLSAVPARAGTHGQPDFNVSVVSTAAGPCRFNIGVRYLALVVTAGKARVFGSADCVRGPGTAFTVLHRGVPVTVTRSWDRRTSAPGCPAGKPLARAGHYTAAAVHEALVSNTEPFQLG